MFLVARQRGPVQYLACQCGLLSGGSSVVPLTALFALLPRIQKKSVMLAWLWGHVAEEALEEVLEYSDLEQRRRSLELDARELDLMERRLHLDIARLEFEALAKCRITQTASTGGAREVAPGSRLRPREGRAL